MELGSNRTPVLECFRGISTTIVYFDTFLDRKQTKNQESKFFWILDYIKNLLKF